jgi:hypothetical protein
MSTNIMNISVLWTTTEMNMIFQVDSKTKDKKNKDSKSNKKEEPIKSAYTYEMETIRFICIVTNLTKKEITVNVAIEEVNSIVAEINTHLSLGKITFKHSSVASVDTVLSHVVWFLISHVYIYADCTCSECGFRWISRQSRNIAVKCPQCHHPMRKAVYLR